jgi:hypothetical protein
MLARADLICTEQQRFHFDVYHDKESNTDNFDNGESTLLAKTKDSDETTENGICLCDHG